MRLAPRSTCCRVAPRTHRNCRCPMRRPPLLGPRDVLVIDEAGMIGTRQMECVLSHAEQAGAQVVLVGDPEPLDRQNVVSGKRVAVRVILGGLRYIKKKKKQF